MRLVKPDQRQFQEPDAEPAAEHGEAKDAGAAMSGALNLDEQQTLMLNLDTSLRVHARPHFFSWTQGMLQSLIRHEVLVCALRSGEPLSLSVDSIAINVADPSTFSDAFLRDAPVAPALVNAWEERRFRPVVCAAGDVKALVGGIFVRELERVGATQLVVHGTHDSDGLMESFFVFGCAPGGEPRRQAYLAQLLVPFLHSAWMRVRMNARTRGNDSVKSTQRSAITPREQEILRWIYLGKSNFEIGSILNISPLTVKNHVQKILRKLNVVNRAQAVGKALDLRILSP
ncbi:MAG TPA: XrtB/PEP-CTERM-associated transcriptional regulator EpsA [Burkholderiales bacterium]